MYKRILILVTILAMTAIACSFDVNVPTSRTGELETMTILEQEPVPGGAARVEISMAGGTLNLSGGGSALVDGTVEYNMDVWEPEIIRTDNTVRIAQEIDAIPIPDTGSEMINRWNLQLGDTPMELSIDAGAYEGTINLSGVPLLGLEIDGGASSAEIRFDTPNPEVMDTFRYSTGASNVNLYGLSNANFRQMDFTGAAGDYLLDFSGDPQQDSVVDIDGAAGQVTIRVPEGRTVVVNVSGGLNDVNTTGVWQTADDSYGQVGSGPKLTINVSMTAGQLELVSE